ADKDALAADRRRRRRIDPAQLGDIVLELLQADALALDLEYTVGAPLEPEPAVGGDGHPVGEIAPAVAGDEGRAQAQQPAVACMDLDAGQRLPQRRLGRHLAPGGGAGLGAAEDLGRRDAEYLVRL